MSNFRIPDDLVMMVAEQRLIPFLGAGFSAMHGLPGWDDLLRTVAAEVQPSTQGSPSMTYDEIRASCDGDNLRIAEYLFLVAGGSIGPLRHAISSCLRAEQPMLESTAHVELANLQAPQVYTTNFDDLLEATYRELGRDADVVSLPRDVARANATRTQIVKYHGDLRHDHTLVLTESQYYTRLDFESPMDLKFRSDLLGRSVLFIGYSFSDVNIRVVWFKLMQMMKDVPPKDRLPSYIVRLRSDPVLDRLYEEVGLRTIVIDPDGTAEVAADRNALLADFMLELAMRAAAQGRACDASAQYVSRGLLAAITAELKASFGDGAGRRLAGRMARFGRSVTSGRLANLLGYLDTRQIPQALLPQTTATFDEVARNLAVTNESTTLGIAIKLVHGYDGCSGATLLIARAMLVRWSRATVEAAQLDWSRVWGWRLSREDAELLLVLIADELDGHRMTVDPFRDPDIAYGVDLLYRIASGEIADEDSIRKKAEALIKDVAALYPAAASYEPPRSSFPAPDDIVVQIEELRRQESHPEERDG